MNLSRPTAEIFVPLGDPVEKALSSTTHLGIGAHQDDLEIMAYHGILQCFETDDLWFSGVTVTNGAGSPRAGMYDAYTDQDMMTIRRMEQKKAASIGEYSAQVFLDFTSAEVKDAGNTEVVSDLKKILLATQPTYVYTHNLADKHDTHVSVALRVIQAIRELPADHRPNRLYGCECWRDLDWLNDGDKLVFDVSAHENLAASLVGLYDSQISGGKRYDLATFGRRRANATFFASHDTDKATSVIFGIDMTPLVQDPELDPEQFIVTYIHSFAADVSKRIEKLSK